MSEVRVLVTGAAGQIGYSLCQMISSGLAFGPNRPVTLVMLDIPPMLEIMEGVVYELQDCAFPLLKAVIPTVNVEEAFKDIDAAFLVGAMPRKEGMERKDLLAANVKIFKAQGAALDKFAKKSVRVLVVGNPANTNALICSKYAPSINPRQISAMTRLDHNRALAQIALKAGVAIPDVRNVAIWGNHSSTQFPDVSNAEVLKGGSWQKAYAATGAESFFKGEFIPLIQKRGAVIIQKRKLSSAMSAAKAACDHMLSWYDGTAAGVWVSMAVVSDGSYGIPAGLMFSFPCTVANGEWSIVQNLTVDEWAREKLNTTQKELEQERDDALEACA